MKADAVFEGGGMRCIAIIGALSYLESQKIQWQRAAGTSAGAVIAALVIAGYTPKELKKILSEMNFLSFMDKTRVQKLPVVGKALGFFLERGIYSGDFVEQWMTNLLAVKGIYKFKDIMVGSESRLKIIASDITNLRKIVLPDDLIKYGIIPSEFSIAKAVRMSTSIPFYFKPVEFIHGSGISYIVDGSVSCSFPLDIFDVDEEPRWPTLGFKFDCSKTSNSKLGKNDPLSFLFDIAETMVCDSRRDWLLDENLARTMLIPTNDVQITDFNLSKEKSIQLFKSGYRAAEKFMENFHFHEYMKKYRLSKNSSNF